MFKILILILINVYTLLLYLYFGVSDYYRDEFWLSDVNGNFITGLIVTILLRMYLLLRPDDSTE